jgi:hypothetical protein
MADRTTSKRTRSTASGSRQAATNARPNAARRTDTAGSSPMFAESAEEFPSGSSKRSTSMAPAGEATLTQLLDRLGVSPRMIETMVDTWKSQLSTSVAHKIEETDVRDALEKAKLVASGSGEKLKDLSRKNPKLFYSGVAAVLMGAGLLASAASAPATVEEDDEMFDEDASNLQGYQKPVSKPKRAKTTTRR